MVDLGLVKVTDSPEELVEHIVTRYTQDLKAWAEAKGISHLTPRGGRRGEGCG